MKFLYKAANFLRKIYWFVFRPKTFGVKCLIENEGKYLLIKTSYSGNYWTLPGGGVGFNESPESAAIREVREEVGIMLDSVSKITKYISAIEYKKDAIYCFHGITSGSDMKIRTSEVAQAQWFPKDQLPENQSKALKEILNVLK